MVKFFTTPPRPYPYYLLNVRRPVLTYVRFAEEVIIDSGVEIFRDPNVKDYPKDHISNLVKLYLRVKALVGSKSIYVTVPDYCDDYHPRSLWLSEDYTNIERTVDNVLKYTEQYKWIPWLIPVQGWNRKPESVLRCIKLYREYGIIDRFEYFGIGNLCVEPDVEIIFRTCKLVRDELRDKKIHVFGLKLPALKYVYHLIDSFDSMAWTRPVDSRGHSCKTTQERIEYFEKWLKRYERIISKSKSKTIEEFIISLRNPNP
jgi:hypothetical protein